MVYLEILLTQALLNNWKLYRLNNWGPESRRYADSDWKSLK